MFSNQLVAVINSPGSIEKLPDFHLLPRIGSSVRARRDIHDQSSQTSRIIITDNRTVPKADDSVQIESLGDASPGLLGFSGMDGKTAIEPLYERLQEDVGLCHGRDASQSEFCDQTVLEDAKEPLHPSFGLGRESKDRLNPQGLQSQSHLSRVLSASQLFLQRPMIIVSMKRAVTVLINGYRDSIVFDDLFEKPEVA